jgi:hypothetical protein
MSLLSFLTFSLQQNWRKGLNRFCPEVEEVAQTMYTCINKCKNDKIKERKGNKMHNIYQRKGNQFPKVLVVNF